MNDYKPTAKAMPNFLAEYLKQNGAIFINIGGQSIMRSVFDFSRY